jgi:hypothetical protein
MQTEFEFFPIVSTDRGDLRQLGFDASGVDDAMMRKLAHRLAISYCPRYWKDLREVAEELGIPKRAAN